MQIFVLVNEFPKKSLSSSGMWNNIGEVWRSQSVGTTALLREGDFHDTVSGIYSTSCKNAIYNMRWQA